MTELGKELEQFRDLLEAGEFDDQLSEVSKWLEARLEILREELRERVKLLFGDDAQILNSLQTGKQNQSTLNAGSSETEKQNPFIAKAQNSGQNNDGPQEPPGLTNTHQSGIDMMDDLEATMAEETGARMPIEMRGATISGLHSSMIA